MSDALLLERIGTLGVLGERKKPMPVLEVMRRFGVGSAVDGVLEGADRGGDGLGEILVLATVALRCKGFFIRAMDEEDCDLAGEEDPIELGSFEGILEVLAGDAGADDRTTGASTCVGSSLTNVPWRSGGDWGASFFGEVCVFGGVLIAELPKPGLESVDLVVRLLLFVSTCVFVTMLLDGDVRGVSNLAMARLGGDGVVDAVAFLTEGTVLVVFR